ncbi:MAG: serine/threonine protein kinase [Planctomycetota bacterium]|nr:MAG: serine/threonine protein kinase [Planctomycetota bacterium]
MADVISDSQVGRLAVERKLMSLEELNDCLEEQKKLLKKEGKRVSLSEVMLRCGFVTRSQIQRLGMDMEDSIARRAQQIPGFQILGKLGQGAMATVFKARQLSLDRIVAIKVLPKKLGENPEFVQRFYKEGRAAARLNHNNIVQAIDVGEAGGYHYFVMEYIDGKTVYDDLAANKIYTEEEALDIVIQVARALEHASERGFVHRDVKPKNVMLTKGGVAKLADMGLARETADLKAAVAEAGRAYGTPYYISPEQIRGEVNIDFRADVYSLGATFYHMVSGKLPFEGTTPAAVMHKHLKEPLIPPDHVVPTLSAGVGEVIEGMMAKKREDRYTSYGDLLTDLEAVARGEPPLQARKRYDDNLLQGLAESGETVEMESPEAEDEPVTATIPLVWVFVIGALLGVSVIVNMILLLIFL